MTELSRMNIRAEPVGFARHGLRGPHEIRPVRRLAGERFVAVRPASPPTDPGVAGRPAAPALPRPPVPAVAAPAEASPAPRLGLPAGHRAALLAGAAGYRHDAYPDLPTAEAGVRHLRQVLERPDLGMMDACAVLADPARGEFMRGLETFLDARGPDDTVLVYLSGYTATGDDGRLCFVATDTDPADLESTAVPAEFVRRLLEECPARHKIVLIDAQPPPSTTDEAPAHPRGPAATFDPAGVYVIASGDLATAPDGTPFPNSLGTSRFTGEIVDALRAGRVPVGVGPWVTADDLFDYLARQAQRWGHGSQPWRSVVATTGGQVIARSAVRALSLLSPPQPARAARAAPADPVPPTEDTGPPHWQRLFAYYRSCLADAPSPEQLASRDDAAVGWFPITSGPEGLLSGRATTVVAPDGISVTDRKDRDLWYGYPMVTLVAGGRRHAAPVLTAPLLVQRVDVVVDAGGGAALRPVGPVLPHAGLLAACLDEQAAAGALASWRATWKPGDAGAMLAAIHELARRLGLAELQPLDPAELTDVDVTTTTHSGLRNAAGVLTLPTTREAAQDLAAELGTLADVHRQIPSTALGQLDRGGSEDLRAAPAIEPPLIVTPVELTERHEQVIEAAMTQRLTVVTAPPGSGHEELIIGTVATAVAAGQKVLVTSPDPVAVNRIVQRCTDLAPGLLLTTGDAQRRAYEKQQLRQLTADDTPRPARASNVVAAELATAREALRRWRDRLAARVDLEARLRRTCSARIAAAATLGVPVEALASAWHGDDEGLVVWVQRARGLVASKLLGSWRARREVTTYLRAIEPASLEPGTMRRLVAEPGTFETLLLFARAELQLRKDQRAECTVSDAQLEREGHTIARAVVACSELLLATALAERVVTARPRIQARRRALEPGGRGRQAAQRELMKDLGGWAVASTDVSQLSLEPAMFDLVIVDQAHHLPAAALPPLLYRAERALVLGDPPRRRVRRELSAARARQARQQAQVSAAWLAERRMTFGVDSVHDAAATAAGRSVLLDEHQGSHPSLARLFDEHFYGGELTVLTDVVRLRRAVDPAVGHATLLLWEDVHGTAEPGPHGGSWLSQAEIDRVVWVVTELRDQLPDGGTIGIVTPFQAQADELRAVLRFEPVRVATADDFEHEPCDAMVVSLVAGEDSPESVVRWVQTRTGLLHTALTAARSHVVTVGDHGFWSTGEGIPATLARASSVRSFHVAPIPPPDDFEPALPADPLADLLYERLVRAGYAQIERDADLDGYRCDFLVAGRDAVPTAVLLDRGPRPGVDPARHLRLLLRRRALLVGLPTGLGGDREHVARVVRVPAWRVRSTGGIPPLIDEPANG